MRLAQTMGTGLLVCINDENCTTLEEDADKAESYGYLTVGNFCSILL